MNAVNPNKINHSLGCATAYPSLLADFPDRAALIVIPDAAKRRSGIQGALQLFPDVHQPAAGIVWRLFITKSCSGCGNLEIELTPNIGIATSAFGVLTMTTMGLVYVDGDSSTFTRAISYYLLNNNIRKWPVSIWNAHPFFMIFLHRISRRFDHTARPCTSMKGR